MNNYQIGSIITRGGNFKEICDYCNLNNLSLRDISEEKNGQKFIIEEMPKSTLNDLTNEMGFLKIWLDTYYMQHEQKYRRLHTLGLKCDNGADPYNELVKLYNEAETKRKRIQKIEELIKNEMA